MARKRTAAFPAGTMADILEAMPDAVVIMQEDGTIVRVNQQVEVLFGYQRVDLIGKPLDHLIPERFRAEHAKHRARYVSHPTTRPMGMGLDLWGRRQDGTEFPVEISLSPLQLGGPHVISAIRDVTERRRLEDELRHSLEEVEEQRVLFQHIIDEMPGGVYLVHGADARLILANETAREVWGADWQIDQPMLAFLQQSGVRILHTDGTEHPTDELATFRAVRGGEAVYQHQEVIRHPNGTTLPILVNAVAIAPGKLLAGREDGDAARLALVVVQDVTSLKDAERLKDEFISSAAHELRNPLTIVRGYADMLLVQTKRGKGPPLANWQDEAIESIDQATRRLVELTEDLLDVTLLQAGRLALHPTEQDLVTIVEKVVDRMRATTKLHRLIVESAAPSVIASIDVLRIEQVLGNLLNNAIKYSPQGGTILLGIQPIGDHVIVRIQDQGIGIPASQRRHLFTRFARAENAREFGIPGTGLGLYLCRELIERHGGTIWFESIEGEGTTFSFSLPRCEEVA